MLSKITTNKFRIPNPEWQTWHIYTEVPFVYTIELIGPIIVRMFFSVSWKNDDFAFESWSLPGLVYYAESCALLSVGLLSLLGFHERCGIFLLVLEESMSVTNENLKLPGVLPALRKRSPSTRKNLLSGSVSLRQISSHSPTCNR